METENYQQKSAVLIFKHKKINSLIEFSLVSKFTFKVDTFDSINSLKVVLASDKKPDLIIIDLNWDEPTLKLIHKSIEETDFSEPIILVRELKDEESNVNNPFSTLQNEMAIISKYEILTKLDEQIEKYFSKMGEDEKPIFLPIHIGILSKIAYLDDDVFIQLKTGRFLKLFSKRDCITDEDVERYNGKGIDYLFLRKNTIKWILKEFSKKMPEVIASLENDEEITVDSSTKESLQEEPEEQPLAFDQELVEEVSAAVKSTIKQIKKNPKLNELLNKLNINRKTDAYFNTHIALLCNISCGLAKELGWGSSATYEKLVFASYLHDFTLLDTPLLARIEDLKEFKEIEETLSEKEKSLFLNHPKEMAELLQTIHDAPQESETLILQHHERPDRTGFPNKLDGSRINLISAVFIVSHHFVDYIIKNPNWSLKDYLAESNDIFSKSSFKKILRVLEKTMVKK